MRAAITGMGAVTALGRGVERLWAAMAAGLQGIGPIERFPTAEFAVGIAGVVPDRNSPRWAQDVAGLCVELAVAAGREALAMARPTVAPARLALVVGTSIGDHTKTLHQVTEAIGDALGARGPRLTVSTACTSSTNALGVALDLLEQDLADVVIAGGADVLTPLVQAGFARLGVLSPGPCAPFSQPAGTSLGEGAGFVIVEPGPHPRARHALLGYGLSSDAFHETSPDPTGSGVARALRGALAHAGVDPAAIDYVNAHGTGTANGDPAEWRGLRQVLGDRVGVVPISSSKSFLGHAQGAAGILELLATLVALEHGAVPATRNFVGPRPNSPADPVAGDRPRPAAVAYALCNNSGFGGANCAVVIGPAAAAVTAAAAAPAPAIYLHGVGAVGSHGQALATLAPTLTGARADVDVTAVVPSVNPRGLDATTRHLIAASGLALDDAGVRVRGAMADRSGLVIGTTRVSAESADAMYRSIDAGGYRQISATMFSRMVLNAPVGACAKALVLKGPLTTLSAGDASGLAAIATAAHLLATRADVDRIIAGGVEEAHRPPEPATDPGAVCVVLANHPPADDRPWLRLAGWALAGPDDRAAAVARAVAMAGGNAPDLVVGPAGDAAALPHLHLPLRAGAASAALAAAAAIAALRVGDATRVLITSEPCASLTCALVLVRDLPTAAPAAATPGAP